MRIAAVVRALPPHRYSQEQIRAKLEQIWTDRPAVVSRLASLHENARVGTRHLALPIEEYGVERTFGASNDCWIRVAQELGEQAIGGALAAAGLGPQDIDAIFVVSVTGIASPSLDARLANRMGLRSDVKRLPIFGLGCVAGVAGISRAADYVKAYPDQVAVLLSVELCSLTFQRGDTSVANAIAAGLFGDGAAAVVVVGAERARRLGLGGLRVLDTRSVFYPDTEDVMGWRVTERGFDLVLSPAVPAIARERLAPDVDRFLAEHGLGRNDIATWVCHPGGPKVLAAMSAGLGLSDADVAHSWRSLADEGNISSTSVLLVLERVLADGPPTPNGRGLMVAMGPAFCSELVLFQWCA
jgi:alkylresorcinol/alkylpyrone synthase